MSVLVLYRGQKKSFKCGSAPMKSTLDDAVRHFRINPTLDCNLIYKNKKIDLSTPFRLTSMPNNAMLELSCGTSNKTGSISETRLAFSCDNGYGNLSGKFRSDMTLFDILSSFVDEGLLPAPLLDSNFIFSPPLEVIYLRQRFIGLEELRGRTLSNLGLGGSNARMQIRIPTTACGLLPNQPDSHSQDSSESLTEDPIIKKELNVNINQVLDRGKRNNSMEGQEEEMLLSIHQGASRDLSGYTKMDKSSDTNPLKDEKVEISDKSSDKAPERKHFPRQISTQSVRSAVAAIMESNFDVATKKALLTAVKYVDNLIKFPDTRHDSDGNDLEKYRHINLRNKIVQERIISCNNGLDLLLALGFNYKITPNSIALSETELCFGFKRVHQDWHLCPDTVKGYSLDSCSYAANEDVALVSTLIDAREVLLEALSQLDSNNSSCSDSILPCKTLCLLQGIARSQAQTLQNPPPVTFDPYKPYIMQSSSDKVIVKQTEKRAVSSTDTKLIQLNKRRLELEGDRRSVQRLTKVTWRYQPTKSTDRTNTEYIEETDGQIQSRALKQVMLRLVSKDDDGPPLTTQAVKDLEKAKNALVYDKTLLRVILPDMVCLQGYFHPRDTLKDIVRWLLEECFSPGSDCVSEGSEKVSGISTHYEFDLYTTPPRKSLFSNDSGDNCMLQDLSLVPAAVIYLSWQGRCTDFGNKGQSSLNYLSSQLVNQLQSTKSEDSKEHSILFPNGKKLVPQANMSRDQGTESTLTNNFADSSTKKNNTNGGAKPKWLKL